MTQQDTKTHHLMIGMIEWYNQFKDFSARDQTNETNRVAAFEASFAAITRCEMAGFCPMSLITDAYDYAAKYNFDVTRVRA
jgi:ribonuclease HI